MPAHISGFDSASQVISNPFNVFVIPTFQRPYAWDDVQVRDLLTDLTTMMKLHPPMHYLSPIHVAHIGSEDFVTWNRYTDPQIREVQYIAENDFRDDDNNQLNVYFVIDGQQRLTTLFALYARFSKKLTITVQGREFPRLLLNSEAHHDFFKANMIGQSTTPQGQSQKRISRLFDLASQLTDVQQRALEHRELKLLLVEVPADYGLKSFLTLNARGKPLSVLDKLKSLWMEKDEEFTQLAELHHVFGDTFRMLDHPAWGDKPDPFGEDRFVRLLGIRTYWNKDTNCVWRNSQQLFEDYFKKEFSEAPIESGNELVARCRDGITRQTGALTVLAEQLGGTAQTAMPSLICSNRSIKDDYKAFFQAWEPDNRSLVFLIRLKDVLEADDWNLAVMLGTNDGQLHHAIFRQTLDRVLNESKRNNEPRPVPGDLQEWWNRLDAEISALRQSQPRRFSALQIVERVDRFVFKTNKNPEGTLQAYWNDSFGTFPKKLAENLLLLGSQYSSYFFRALLEETNWDAIYRHVLGEFESDQDGSWLHGDPNFELEHIFPLERPSTDEAELERFGFRDLQDYQRFTGSLGNRILIWTPLNGAIGNRWPDIKAGAYANQRFAQTTTPVEYRRASSMNLGRTLQDIGETRFYRLALEMRRIELGLFALRRFSGASPMSRDTLAVGPELG